MAEGVRRSMLPFLDVSLYVLMEFHRIAKISKKLAAIDITITPATRKDCQLVGNLKSNVFHHHLANENITHTGYIKLLIISEIGSILQNVLNDIINKINTIPWKNLYPLKFQALWLKKLKGINMPNKPVAICLYL